MKKILLATIAVTVFAVPAMAADLRVKAPVKAPVYKPPAYSWTGCYVGGHLGGVWAEKEWFDRDPGSIGISFGQSEGSHEPSGFIGGVQGGCDYQFAGGFVIGIAGDYAWADAEGSNVSLVYPDYINFSKVKGLASVTGRIGFAWDRFLGYVKGGGAWERDDFYYTGPTTAALSATRSGWTIGVGGEYAFTNWLTGFVEYNYYDFGNREHLFRESDGTTYNAGIEETKSVVKVGLNFRFGGPVMAKY